MSYTFEIKKTDIDLDSLYNEINKEKKLRQELGVYNHFDFSKVTNLYLKNIKDKSKFIDEHIKSINQSWAVDINDFEFITQHNGILKLLEILVKRVIWKLLKFYTYRLFSMQREYNMQISNALISMHKAYDIKLKELSEKIKKD